MKTFESHDLTLPAWGPYTKLYSGVSHIPQANNGTRFDLAVFPGFFRRRVEVPNVRFEGNWHMWQAAPDLSSYTIRYELEWKDRVYADISFMTLGDNACLIRAELNNRTDLPQNLVLHYAASAHDPTPSGKTWSIPGADIFLPESAVLVMANNYETLHFATPRSSDNLNWDGLRRAEEAVPGFLHGYGIGMSFGTAGGPTRFGRVMPSGKGDRVAYRFIPLHPIRKPCLLVRYCNDSDTEGLYQLSTGELLRLPPSKKPTIVTLPLANPVQEQLFLELTSHGQGNAKFDCFVLCEYNETDRVHLAQKEPGFRPTLETSANNSIALQYPHLAGSYAIAWNYDSCRVRQIENDTLDVFLRDTAHDHVHDVLTGNQNGHFTDIFMRPIPLKPDESRVIWAVAVHNRTPEQATTDCITLLSDVDSLQARWHSACVMMSSVSHLPAGNPFAFGQQLMQAVLSTNVVYPVYTRHQYIRHNTPGRWWDSLYTWDSGFIGMGLATLSIQRGLECLRAYLTPAGDDENAFIHHGTLLPTQFYLFAELINRPEGRREIASLYPMLRSAYEFFVGRSNGSSTANLSSGLLRPWDYFYNSGGWDDYPPQQEVLHSRHLQQFCTPVVTTAHAIRFARILSYAASVLNLPSDHMKYQQDADYFSERLNSLAWDEEAGYYSYLVHDEQGRPHSFLRNKQGINFNMGMDGASPLFAGACTGKRAQLLWDKLHSEQHLWTHCGLSAVDCSAPYHRTDGYWNGSVWMPYQWLFFKAALDCADFDFAFRIAHTALSVWRMECTESYHCFEHFMVDSERGAGWHQFGGLSSPVLQWFASYYCPGTITTGFDTFVSHVHWSSGNTAVSAQLDCTRAGSIALLVALEPGKKTLHSNARTVQVEQRHAGLWEIIFHVERPGQLKFSLE